MVIAGSKKIVPIVEYFELNTSRSSRDAKWELLSSDEGKYGEGVRAALRAAKGIYLFYDSRGRAIYAGKAVRQSLWSEMTAAFNRDRKDLQTVKLVSHPSNNVAYKPYDEKIRQPRSQQLYLHDIAYYFSAYEVKEIELISTFEALIVRAFANDLLNKKMEKFK